jgi:hypothetical protein
VVDGLALLGVERLVVDGYRFQIMHAAWSWRLLYRLTRSRILIRLAGALLARLASRRLIERIAGADPDVVVSAYPIVSLALAGLRRRARLPWPCATLVTDFDPHPAWVHPDLDERIDRGSGARRQRRGHRRQQLQSRPCPLASPRRRPLSRARTDQRPRDTVHLPELRSVRWEEQVGVAPQVSPQWGEASGRAAGRARPARWWRRSATSPR